MRFSRMLATCSILDIIAELSACGRLSSAEAHASHAEIPVAKYPPVSGCDYQAKTRDPLHLRCCCDRLAKNCWIYHASCVNKGARSKQMPQTFWTQASKLYKSSSGLIAPSSWEFTYRLFTSRFYALLKASQTSMICSCVQLRGLVISFSLPWQVAKTTQSLLKTDDTELRIAVSLLLSRFASWKVFNSKVLLLKRTT